MSLFDIFKKKQNEPNRDAAPQKPELSEVEQHREQSVASGEQIVTAIDALLFSLRVTGKYPQLTEDNIATLSERFNNVQKVLGATHCDSDVSELDSNILILVQGLESQMVDSPMQAWEETLTRLNAAVLARLKSDYEIRLAALDMSELYLMHTNEVWKNQIASLEAAKNEITDEVEKLRLDEMTIGTRKNLLVNVKRLEEIKSLRLQLQNDRVSPSGEVIKGIENLLSSIRTAKPEFMKIAEVNAEAIRQKNIETRVAVSEMREANRKLQDALDAAEMQASAQSARMERAAEQVAQAVQETGTHQEREAVAE